MQLDIKKAIISPFLDKDWYIKILFPIILMPFGMVFYYKSYIHHMATFIPKTAILLFLIICLAMSLLYSGFMVVYRHNAIYNHCPSFPELNNIWKDFLIFWG